MFDLSKIQNIKAGETADAKIEKLRAEQETVKQEIQKAEREIEQSENRIKRLTQSLSQEQRKARTKRLIERGAIVETFIPESENLSNEQLQTFLKIMLTSDYAVTVLAKLRGGTGGS